MKTGNQENGKRKPGNHETVNGNSKAENLGTTCQIRVPK
jgi:hypothetical protein